LVLSIERLRQHSVLDIVLQREPSIWFNNKVCVLTQLNSPIRQLLYSNLELFTILNSKLVCIDNFIVGILPLDRLFETHSLWLIDHVKVSLDVVILLDLCLEPEQVRSTDFIL